MPKNSDRNEWIDAVERVTKAMPRIMTNIVLSILVLFTCAVFVYFGVVGYLNLRREALFPQITITVFIIALVILVALAALAAINVASQIVVSISRNAGKARHHFDKAASGPTIRVEVHADPSADHPKLPPAHKVVIDGTIDKPS